MPDHVRVFVLGSKDSIKGIVIEKQILFEDDNKKSKSSYTNKCPEEISSGFRYFGLAAGRGARAYLTVIAKGPEAVMRALGRKSAQRKKKVAA